LKTINDALDKFKDDVCAAPERTVTDMQKLWDVVTRLAGAALIGADVLAGEKFNATWIATASINIGTGMLQAHESKQ
jgi:hypothetical protein